MNAQTQIDLTESLTMMEDDILDLAKTLHKSASDLSKKTATANELRDTIRSTRGDMQAALLAEDDDALAEMTKSLRGLNNKLDKAIEAHNDADQSRQETLAKLVAILRGAAV